MGRPREGWKLRAPREPGKPYTVRFTSVAGHPVERSCRTEDAGEAAREAARIYARDLATGGIVQHARINPLLALDELMALWLADMAKTHDEQTVETYTAYARRYVQFFGNSIVDITRPRMGDYQRARLTKVLRTTVQKERSALNVFFDWCTEQRVLAEEAVPLWPKLSEKALGVRSGPQREAPVDVTVEQVFAFLAALPAWSKPRMGVSFPIRARFIVAYETGLRPALLDELTMPKHWKPGQDVIVIERQHDKARYGRKVPITAIARTALEITVKALGLTEGPIFGHHDYRDAFEKARIVAGLPEDFAPYDLRHGRAGHLLDASADMRGVAFLLGHKRLTTTDKYLRGQESQARAALTAIGSGDLHGKDELAMGSAKEGTRTLTGVTPLEPESGVPDKVSGTWESESAHNRSENAPVDQGSGDVPETVSRAAKYLAALRATDEALELALASELLGGES